MSNNEPQMYDNNDMKKIFSMAAQYMGVEYDEEKMRKRLPGFQEFIKMNEERSSSMKYDGENAYILFACNLHKERDSMRVVAIAADKATLYAIIGNEILNGDMDYKGYAKQKCFALFREDYKKGEISTANLDYGYYEEQSLIEQGYTNMQQECAL